jgi:hypothetical protein
MEYKKFSVKNLEFDVLSSIKRDKKLPSSFLARSESSSGWDKNKKLLEGAYEANKIVICFIKLLSVLLLCIL